MREAAMADVARMRAEAQAELARLLDQKIWALNRMGKAPFVVFDGELTSAKA